ncbi:MAG: AAA family ATPase [Bacteroidaceae bacterium]|nr:AAA family ATPase [Bacteroidaceae bacterium]
MIAEALHHRILTLFEHEPTSDQVHAIDTFCQFASDFETNSAMILCGSAGTGKTTLASVIVKAMKSLGQKVVLLAPTGRAAKVFSQNADTPAFTIHRKIYRQKAYTGLGGQFQLADNMARNTLFLIDEASMIADDDPNYDPDFNFGSGSLLDDLINYVYNGSCRMLLIGDRYQLPPVGFEESPALSPEVLRNRYLKTYTAELDEVVRQASESGILYNAQLIRKMITEGNVYRLPKLKLKGFSDIESLPGNELVETLDDSYYDMGDEETMVITRSNKMAVRYNNGIRQQCKECEDDLEYDDMITIVKNNYYWTERDKSAPMPFIANGDRARVKKIRNEIEYCDFTFCDCTLEFPDYDNYEMTCTVIKNTLQSESPSLTYDQQQYLYNMIMKEYEEEIPLKADRLKALKNDPYYNALQIKYAYASTCHKAQGGQWEHVYIEQGYVTEDMVGIDYYRWLYTAITRATSKLYLINWNKRR